MRYQTLDILRGIAIILMMVFHLNYAFTHVFYSDIINISETFWSILGKVSAFGFMMIAGFSMYLAKQKYSQAEFSKKYLKYAGILGLISGGITSGTILFFPSQMILFGILHFFALSFLILSFVLKNKILTGFIFLLSIVSAFFVPVISEYSFLFSFGLIESGFYSADYYPVFPYIGVIIFGYFLACFFEKYDVLKFLSIQRELYLCEKILSYAGQKSLLLYLIHMPIILVLLYLIF